MARVAKGIRMPAAARWPESVPAVGTTTTRCSAAPQPRASRDATGSAGLVGLGAVQRHQDLAAGERRRVAGRRRVDEQDRRPSSAERPEGDAADEQPLQSPLPVRREHDQVGAELIRMRHDGVRHVLGPDAMHMDLHHPVAKRRPLRHGVQVRPRLRLAREMRMSVHGVRRPLLQDMEQRDAGIEGLCRRGGGRQRRLGQRRAVQGNEYVSAPRAYPPPKSI